MASREGGRILLRIEDHDRTRSRRGYDAALLEDLEWLGFQPDEGPVRQSDDDGPYRAALERLRDAGLVYGCDCSRTTFERWRHEHGRPWGGPGCPGECQGRALAGPVLRVTIGGGSQGWPDGLMGPCADEIASAGDPTIRDRDGQWTYLFAVVVDDLRQGIDLVIRGQDLLTSTPSQIRLGTLLGRARPAIFAHHPLIRRADGAKLSKASRDTSVRELRAAGRTAPELIGEAAAAVGLLDVARPVAASEVWRFFASGTG